MHNRLLLFLTLILSEKKSFHQLVEDKEADLINMPLIDRSSLNKQWETEMLEDLLQLDKNDIEEAIAQMEYNAEILE